MLQPARCSARGAARESTVLTARATPLRRWALPKRVAPRPASSGGDGPEREAQNDRRSSSEAAEVPSAQGGVPSFQDGVNW
jgi:hypothetical protein